MKKIFLGILSLTFMFTSCNNDDDNTTDATSNLVLDLQGLEDLGPNYAYEGWVLVDGAPISTGVFTVDANGTLSSTSFEVPATTLADATKFILSIEPSPDSDPNPSDQKLIAGDFSGSSAAVSTGVAPAVGEFSTSTGSFFMRSPTDETTGNNGNDQYGVWFGVPGTPPTADFTLPTLPTGWAYEGWVVVDGVGPISTGTFTDFSAVDNFDGFSGDQPGPPVPGEDFFNNAPTGVVFPLDVRNRTIVISVEPVPDNSPAPFGLKPLLGTAGTETAPTAYPFAFNAGGVPTGTVTR